MQAHLPAVASGTATVCDLFVHKSAGAPAARPWRLLWAESIDAPTFVHEGGEVSYRSFRSIRDAIAYGQRQYGETATLFPH